MIELASSKSRQAGFKGTVYTVQITIARFPDGQKTKGQVSVVEMPAPMMVQQTDEPDALESGSQLNKESLNFLMAIGQAVGKIPPKEIDQSESMTMLLARDIARPGPSVVVFQVSIADP